MTQWKLFSRAVIVLVVAMTITACGFHLRGNIPLPDAIKNMYVSAPDGSFKDQLEELLTNAGAVLAANPAGADVVLKVTKAELDRTVGTLDERGKADSYNLIFSIEYTLVAPDGAAIRDVSLKESRRYNFDPALVIESESEEADLLKNMEQSIALRVIRQLSTVTDVQPTDDQPE